MIGSLVAALLALVAPSPAVSPPTPPDAVAPSLLATLESVPPHRGLVVVPGTSPVVGTGPVRRFAVEVERGVRVARRAFAASVQRILLDPRGWTGAGRLALQRVDSGQVDLRVTLARPATVDRLCYPLHTAGFADCFNRGRAVINVDRWTEGTVPYAGDLGDYRDYLINHEVGHGLGHGHRACPGIARRSFVMMQQTGTTFGCRRQPWPRASEQRRALVPPRVLVLGEGPVAGAVRALGAPDARLTVRTLADPATLTRRALRGVAAVVALAPPASAAALRRYVRHGGGLVVVGPAVGWPGWRSLVGASAGAAPLPAGTTIAVRTHREPPTRLLGQTFASAGPFMPAVGRVRGWLLASAGDAPVAWCRRDGQGRVFADSLAAPDAATMPGQALLAGGLAWTVGVAQGARCR